MSDLGKERVMAGIEQKGGVSEQKQNAVLRNRERLALDGVSEVLSFDETTVVLRTLLGTLTVEGEGLRVTKLLLDCGEVNIEGKIAALFYEERTERSRGGLFRKLGG
jgi:sporulation protein YabP